MLEISGGHSRRSLSSVVACICLSFFGVVDYVVANGSLGPTGEGVFCYATLYFCH